MDGWMAQTQQKPRKNTLVEAPVWLSNDQVNNVKEEKREREMIARD